MRNVVSRMIGAVFALALAAGAQAEQTALDRFVVKPDLNYAYDRTGDTESFFHQTIFFKLTSLEWREPHEVDRTLWEHDVFVTIPRIKYTGKGTVLLLIDGGSNGDRLSDELIDASQALATAAGMIVAVVRQVPNQPLYFADETEPRTEDEILAYSMDKFLDTGDEEWPVHLAMTKSVMRAMDLIDQYLPRHGERVDDFILMGASKRGWTAWLTAAVDPRVKAIMPISADLLNLHQQFPHHWEAYGLYAPALQDYAEFDLPCRTQSKRGRALWDIIDPYSYRDRYTMPKLVISSAGDQFFVTDSSRYYYDQLPDPKLVRYTFNTDHSQGGNVDAVLDLLSAAMLWVDDVTGSGQGPEYAWTFEDDDGIRVEVVHKTPDRVYLWQAHNPQGRDFRLETFGANWVRTELSGENGVYIARVDPPEAGYKAFAVEMVYKAHGLADLFDLEQVFTTEVRIIPDTMPYAGEACWSDSPGYLETPADGGYQSGIGVLAGWICDAGKVELVVDGERYLEPAYGARRVGTAEHCGDEDNGFGMLYNLNLFGSGEHQVIARADGRKFDLADFTVMNFDTPFLRGASGIYDLLDFPAPGRTTQVMWQESQQNFAIAGLDQTETGAPDVPRRVPRAAESRFWLDNPAPDSFQSGVGMISGWICEADKLELSFDGRDRKQIPYGAPHGGTVDICGDRDNAFGMLYNFNLLGPGPHQMQLFADDEEIERVNFSVTTFGEPFVRGLSAEYSLPGFPEAGQDTWIQWQESLQNFTISGGEATEPLD